MNIEDIDFSKKRVLIRVDFNVPYDENYKITDSTRIIATKKTIYKVLEGGGSVILMSHMGRPKGEKIEKYSFKNLLEQISDLIGLDIKFYGEIIGPKVTEAVKILKVGETMLLENLRFYKQEEEGNEEYAKKLASFADVYINDAFGTAHRAHASTSVIAKYFKEKCFGYLMKAELEAIELFFNKSKKPVTAIIGGAKVSSKIKIIENIFPIVDNILIGGGMSYTFIKANGGKTGDSLVEDEYLEEAKQILTNAKQQNVNIYLPEDSIIADRFDQNAEVNSCNSNEIPEGWMALDIGPKAIFDYKEVLKESNTILWNGPMGVFEFKSFENGTKSIGNALAEATKKGAYSLIGGGDSAAAAKKFSLIKQISYISTGGGAMLEALEGKVLPGVTAMLEE